MLNVKLTKIESSHSNLRTNEMVGKTGSIPEAGYGFLVFGESLTEGNDFRRIETTAVQVSSYNRETKTFTFKTLNSLYSLEVLDKTLTDEEILSFGKWKKNEI